MKIHIVQDIAPNSTFDVARGLYAGLVSLGHEVSVTSTEAYAVLFTRQFEGMPLDAIPKNTSACIWGAVNKLILADVVMNRPDAVLVVSGWAMARVIAEKIREIGVFTALYLTESPYQDREQAEQEAFGTYDVIFCNEHSSMAWMRMQHDNVVYLPHSYNPEIHRPVPGPAPDYDLFFCGTSFTERIAYAVQTDWSPVRPKFIGFWKPAHGMDSLPEFCEDRTIKNSELPAIYSNVPLNLNVHRTTRNWRGGAPDEEHISYAESIGPRVYEVLACGGFLLSDHRAEMDGFLEDGIHLATFADARELGQLARHYLQHGEERARIAAAGRAAVANCTFGRRCEQYVLPNLMRKEVLV